MEFVIKLLPLVFLMFVVFLPACDTQVKSTDNCGDGYLDPGEQCDGSEALASTCEQLGYYSQTGDLRCKSDCTLDTSVCSSRCGDDVVQALYEQCEGANLAGQTCQSQGLGAGTLTCTADCHFDISGCEVQAVCGDDTIQSPFEQCEGSNLDGQDCVSLGYYEGTLVCDADCRYDLSSCISFGRCGDGTLQAMYGEVCEGSNLDGESCESLGFYGGTLTCGADCRFRTENCESIGACGDETIQANFDEVCDGTNLDGQTCVTRGYHGGDLACTPDCGAFDETDCVAVGRCGDTTVQTAFGEDCDGASLAGQTCLTLGFYGGTLACTAGCAFDTTDCATFGRCGDGALHAAEGEACDGASLAGQTCLTLGFYGGDLACTAGCAFDTSGCAAVGRCGDATIQNTHGEVCDGVNLGGQTCLSRGFYGGTLTCAADCGAFDESGCAAVGRCGDTTVQTAFGEDCDGANLNGTACVNLGYYGGDLACTGGCDFDTADCATFGRCGDATIQTPHGEVCDGVSLAGQTCVTRGFYGGTLACTADCGAFDESDCASVGRCGDGLIQTAHGEECDGANLDGQTCGDFGFYTGTLSCDASCRLVKTACAQTCGDGATQLAFGELCDGDDLNGQSCVTRGYYAGTLACNPDCHGFDETSCVAAGRCGDSLVQTLYGEDCDGVNLDSQTCISLGYYSGTLSCQANCDFNLTNCASFGRCGDGSIQAGYGEVCDGANLDYETCVTMGWYGGTLTCQTDCKNFDQSDCAAQGKCGDETIQEGYGEVCDGSNLGLDPSGTLPDSCVARGYYGGQIVCQNSCSNKNLADCENYGRCGDNVFQPLYEECDGVAPPGASCLDYGYYEGTLSCDGNCQIVPNCTGSCNDGTLQSGYEDCDGSLLGGETCVSLGYYGGTLSCQSTCDYDLSTCELYGRCGDGIIQAGWGEECDGTNLDSRTCRMQQHFTGTLSCDPNSCWFDETQCTDVVSIATGDNHSCAAFDDGSVRCWGHNNFGQLGDGSTVSSDVPVLVVGVTDAASVSAGASHTCAVLLGGGLKCWGLNQDGQLGDGTQINRLTPVPVNLTNVVEVAAGTNHTCARQGSGTSFVAKCWGAMSSNYGQLGNGSTVGSTTPVPVGGGYDDIRSISAGHHFTCSAHITSARCWGRNDIGQLGDGSYSDRTMPTEVQAMYSPSMVSAGFDHACAFRSTDNVLKCWGNNDRGQLGNGTTVPANTAQFTLDNVLWVSAGGKFACAIITGGEVYCWGSNLYGQLGDGTYSTNTLPHAISGTFTDIFQVDAGNAHACMFHVSGAEGWCWGFNDYGQIGDDSNVTVNIPVLIRP